MLYSCTHMATVGFKGLNVFLNKQVDARPGAHCDMLPSRIITDLATRTIARLYLLSCSTFFPNLHLSLVTRVRLHFISNEFVVSVRIPISNRS